MGSRIDEVDHGKGFDRITVAAMAAMAFVLGAALHEHAGHALACHVLGGHVRAFGAFYVDCDYRDMSAMGVRWVALAGPVVSVLVGIVGTILMPRCARPLPRLFWWLFASIGYMTGFGYLLFSAVAGIGDLGTGPDGALHALPNEWLWRVPMGVLGYGLYDRAVVWSMRHLGDMVGGGTDRVRRIRAISLTAYIAIGVSSVLIGLLNPQGLVIVLTSAAAASLGGTSGFAWGPYRAHPSSDDPRPRNTLPRSIAWIAAGIIVVAAYAVVFGPTIAN